MATTNAEAIKWLADNQWLSKTAQSIGLKNKFWVSDTNAFVQTNKESMTDREVKGTIDYLNQKPASQQPLTGSMPADTKVPLPSTPTITKPTDASAAVTQTTDTLVASQNADTSEANKLKATYEQGIKDIETLKNENIKSEQDFADKKEESIKKLDTQLAQMEKEKQALITKRLERDVENMKTVKDTESKKLDAAAELQAYKDEQAIKEAKRWIEVSQMQANVALNKMGLTFSTGAINTTQTIATNGFTAIAGLKIQSNYNQADFEAKATELEFDFTTDINKTIDTYTNQQIKLKEDTANRIADTQNNLLLTERERIDNIAKIKEEYIKAQVDTEEKIYSTMTQARARAEKRAYEIQEQMIAEETRQKASVAEKISNWSFHMLPSSKKAEIAAKAGMSVEELTKIEDNYIQSKIYEMSDKILWADFLFTMDENVQITSTVKRLVESGVGMEQAIDRAVADTIRKNPEYIKAQQIKAEQEAAALRNAKQSGIPRASGWGGGGSSSKSSDNTQWWAFKATMQSNYWLSLTDAQAKNMVTELSWMSEEEQLNYISSITKPTDVETSKKSQTFIDSLKSATSDSLVTSTAQSTYDSLVSDGYTPSEAATIVASSNSNLKIVWEKVINTIRKNEDAIIIK